MITASVVLYNTKIEYINRVIKSYNPGRERRLFLIDNSEEPIWDFRDKENISYIFNGKNMGYGAAHNIALKKAFAIGSEFHLVLNPDLEFDACIIDELISYSKRNPEVVYILPKVIYPNGETQYLCKLLPTPFDLIFRRFFPKKISHILDEQYTLKNFGYDRVLNPPCLSGCFMFMRVSALKENNLLFDERFFMYCEDFDLIRRLHRIGKTIFYPNVTIIHDHEKASYKSVKMLLVHIRSAVKYFNKYGWVFDRERRMENKKILREIKDS